jgi:hypothetical protein
MATGSSSLNVFMVSSPLQLLISRAIIAAGEPGTEFHVGIVGKFSGAEAVAERLRDNYPLIASVRYFHTFADARSFIVSLHTDKLFIDSDLGVRKFLDLVQIKARLPELEIAVYEEGWGTYRTDIYSGVRKALFQKIGIGTHFGGCGLVSEIHVLQPRKYLDIFPKSRVRIVNVPQGPMAVIQAEFDAMCRIFDYVGVAGTGEKCCVYLSSWTADRAILEELAQEGCDTYFKPHPHFSGEVDYFPLILVSNNAPAELVLADLVRKYRLVKVYHHGSSVSSYCQDDRVEFVRI